MNGLKRLERAKSQLVVSHPYFGMLAMRLKHKEDAEIATYHSDGTHFSFNKEYIVRCSEENLKFILINAAMHHVLSHQQRKLNRKGALWQLATDFAINNLLYENGIAIPEGANYDASYKKMYAEEIYHHLHEHLISAASDASPEAQAFQETSEVLKEHIKSELQESEQDAWEYAKSIAKEVAQRKSTMPSGLERLAKKLKTQSHDWRFELYSAINRHMRNDYAFMPPNKKHTWRGVALPSLKSDTLSLCVAIDSSGSIDEALLGVFIDEFKTIMQSFPAFTIELLIADAKVQAHYTFHSTQKFEFSIRGGGSTDFRPVFDYIEATIPFTGMLLYFTDGEGRFPKVPPMYEVLWALSKKAKVPFGRALQLF